jgi:hypothetical protein
MSQVFPYGDEPLEQVGFEDWTPDYLAEVTVLTRGGCLGCCLSSGRFQLSTAKLHIDDEQLIYLQQPGQHVQDFKRWLSRVSDIKALILLGSMLGSIATGGVFFYLGWQEIQARMRYTSSISTQVLGNVYFWIALCSFVCAAVLVCLWFSLARGSRFSTEDLESFVLRRDDIVAASTCNIRQGTTRGQHGHAHPAARGGSSSCCCPTFRFDSTKTSDVRLELRTKEPARHVKVPAGVVDRFLLRLIPNSKQHAV